MSFIYMVGLIGKMPQITTTQVWKLKRPFLFYLEQGNKMAGENWTYSENVAYICYLIE